MHSGSNCRLGRGTIAFDAPGQLARIESEFRMVVTALESIIMHDAQSDPPPLKRMRTLSTVCGWRTWIQSESTYL